MFFNSSHTFLSMIFGFLRKFWVGVVKNIFPKNIFSRRKFFRKDIEKYFSRPKNVREKILWKSQWKMKISKFWFFRFFPEFWNFIFSLTFSYTIFDFFCRPKNLIFFSMKIFFDRKLFSEKNLDHLFRSQIFQRFQKSYLEKSPMSLEIPKTPIPNFWSWIIGISTILVTFYVALPLRFCG